MRSVKWNPFPVGGRGRWRGEMVPAETAKVGYLRRCRRNATRRARLRDFKRLPAAVDKTDMDNCPSCGARVTPDMAWCGQCLTSLPAKEPASAPWARQHTGRQEMARAEFSRWRGGDMSFGPAGKLGMTVGLIVLAVVGYPLAQGGIFMLFGVPIPTVPAIIGYCLAASPLCGWALSRIWRRARIA